jgi:hypothetical protein
VVCGLVVGAAAGALWHFNFRAAKALIQEKTPTEAEMFDWMLIGSIRGGFQGTFRARFGSSPVEWIFRKIGGK